MHAPESVSVLAKIEGEGREGPGRSQPHKTVGAEVHGRRECVGKVLPNGAADPVRPYDEIGVQVELRVASLGLKVEPDSRLLTPALQDEQQFSARDARKAMSGGLQAAALVMNVDVVPVVKALRNRPVGFGVSAGDFGQGVVGKDHAEAEGIVRAVALEDFDLTSRIRLLEQDSGEQAARAAADDVHFHDMPRTRAPPMIRCWISVVPS